jgi:DNA-binding MarR family transcriptional regulator
MFHVEPIFGYHYPVPDQMLDLLDRLVVGSVAVTARAITETGVELTFAQWRALLVIGEDSGGLTIHEIAARLDSKPSPTSRLVSRLKRRSLVSSAKDDRDGRVTRIRLTETGLGLRERILEERRRKLSLVLDRARLGPGHEDAIENLTHSLEGFS